MIPKVHNAATPTCRGGVSPSVCLPQAVSGRCCYEFNWPPLGGGGGSSRDLDRKLWISEGRDEGWTCGMVISGLLWVHYYDHLGCPSRALQFHRSHLFLLMCWKAGGAVDPGWGSGCTNIF